MGLFDRFLPSKEAAGFIMGQTPLRSPFASSTLTKIVLNDVYGIANGDASRAAAMKIPAIVRGRGLIAGTLSRHPLALFDYADGTKLEPASWMVSTDTNQSPSTRMLWTLDDLIFAGMSVWAVERDDNGLVTDALRINPQYWTVDNKTNSVLVEGKPVNPDEVIIFEGPQDPLTSIAAEAIVASRNMSNAWQQRVESPIPLVELHQTDANDALTEEEIEASIAAWDLARRNGGTAYTPAGIQVITHGEVQTDLFIQGRNAERLDWGNYMNLPAAMLDGSMSTATLTYSTSEGKRSEFVDYSLSYWASPIEARLSQDDVTPPGTYTRFDLEWLTKTEQSATNAPMED